MSMRLVRESERARITGVPRSTWYLKMQQGLAPKPVPLGEHAVAWVESELIEWVEAQIARRNSSAK
jgi:prophage regulatory protein